MTETDVRWNLKVSRDTDLSLRTYLGARGMKKGDLSKFVEEAVRWRIFDRTVRDIKARNKDTEPEELMALVDEVVRATRKERAKKRRQRSEGFRG